MSKWRNFREEIEDEIAEIREQLESQVEDQKLMLSCIQNCHIGQLRNLMARGVDTNFCDKYGASPLHIATALTPTPESIEMLELLVYFGALLERRDRFGLTPLHNACKQSSSVVAVLLNAGASVNCQDNAGRTPLMLACESDSPEALVIVQSLLDRGANPNLKDEDGETATYYIVSNRHADMTVRTEIIYKLLYAGADVHSNRGNNSKGSPPICKEMANFLLAEYQNTSYLVDSHSFDVFKALVRGGASCKCLQHYQAITVNQWARSFINFFRILEPMTSVSQVKQIASWLKSPQQPNDSEEYKTVMELLKKSMRTVRTLKSSSRIVVRIELRGKIFPNVDKLNLPKTLEDYLTYNECV